MISVSRAVRQAAPKGQTLAFGEITVLWDNNCQNGSRTNPPDLSSLFKYYHTPLNIEQVLGQKIGFEKVQLTTDSLQVMSGVTFNLKPSYIVSNTLFLKSSAQFGMIRDGKFCSELCTFICQLNVPHIMLSGKHAQEFYLIV